MKDLDVCGLGNALVDVLVEVDDQLFAQTGFKKASMTLADAEEQAQLLKSLEGLPSKLVSGGSVANSIVAAAQLGARAALISTIADDRYGRHYEREFRELGITLANPLLSGRQTGTCVSLITPDAERTMRTCLAVNSELGPQTVSEEIISRSAWLFLEGYLFSTPPNGTGAVTRAIELAKHHGCKIAVTFSEAWVVQACGPALREAVAAADLVFANEAEVCAFTGSSSLQDAFLKLTEAIPNVALTGGSKGALVKCEGRTFHVPAFACEPRDLTGAGDMFAGALLYGIVNRTAIESATRAACYLAMQVISQIGARLPNDGAREHWERALVC